MRPRIVFLLMSAVHPVHVVKELTRALAPHIVLVHHDFSQSDEFALDEPNVIMVPDPKVTGWGVWGFSEGIFHSIQFALENLQFDYLQLLSPTCLPIKPLKAFEDYIVARTTERDFSGIDLYRDRDALMSVGYRMFAREHTLAHRILRRLSLVYFGDSIDVRDVAGVQIRTNPSTLADGSLPWKARAALKVTQRWSQPAAVGHIFDEKFRPYFGSAWFGARRELLEWMLARFRQADIMKQFQGLRIPEELVIPTLLKNSGSRDGAYNHCIITFRGPNPKWLDDDDFEALRQSPAFFARKFPVEPTSSIRRRVLLELAGEAPRSPAPPASKASKVPSRRAEPEVLPTP